MVGESGGMPHHCAVPMWTSNSKTSPGLSFHKFPTEPVTKAIWVRNIRRDEVEGAFIVNSSSRVCGLHFVDADYYDGGRQRERRTSRQNRILKRGSVPTKFTCFPERLRRPANRGENKRKAPTERKEPPPPKTRKEPPTSSISEAPSSTADANESSGPAAPSSEQKSPESSTSDHHDHCECVDQLMDDLARLDLAWKKEGAENTKLREDLEKEKQPRDFCLDRFKKDDGKFDFIPDSQPLRC